MHLSSHNTEQQLRALVFNLTIYKTLYICTPEELPVSDFVQWFYSLKVHRLKSGLQASSLSSPLKIGQKQPGYNVVASCLSQLYIYTGLWFGLPRM